MSRTYLTVGQDLREQAQVQGLKLKEADSDLFEKYCDAGIEMTPEEWEEKKKEPLRPDSPRLIESPIGLALSGGGIRSATFNLGVLQALHQHKLLEAVDYLSTVSGGGYVGGFWSTWRRWRHAAKDTDSRRESTFPDPDDSSIRHLRSFSNFLRPRLNLIGFETGRMTTAFIAGLVPTLLVTLSVMTLTLIAWLGLAHLFMDLPQAWATLSVVLALSLAFVIFHFAWATLAKGEDSVEGERTRAVFWTLVVIALTGWIWNLAWYAVPLPMQLRVAPVTVADVGASHLAAAVLPSVSLLVPFLLLSIARAVFTRRATDFRRRRLVLTSLESVLSRTLFLALVWLGFGVAWVGGQVVAGSGLAGVVSALSVSGAGGGTLVWAQRFLRPQPNKPGGGRALSALGTSSLQVVAYLTLLALLLLVASLISKVYGSWGGFALLLMYVGSLLLAIVPAFFNPQEVGFHSFYRQRIARAYLGAAKKDFPDVAPVPETATQTQASDATLECAWDDSAIDCMTLGRPLHLICCAANDLAGDPIKTLHRGADSAVLSGAGIQVSSTFKPWSKMPTKPLLGSALTASAAAFNSHMGGLSMKLGQAATFLLTALNLRLGMWTENPRAMPGRGRWIPAFYRELFGLSDLDATKVHLSDGAHFENLALYELIRRRCRFLVVCDCGSDPDYAFDDFANAVRRIRTDFGVEIELDPEPLRPGDDGRARQAVVSGIVRYPIPKTPGPVCDDGEAEPGDEDPFAAKELSEEQGLLLLVKPTLAGGEPADVRQYARRSQAFPQETTADQFYDEQQWEAYRRLGEHTMSTAILGVDHLLPKPRECTARNRLRWAMVHGYKHWLPRLDLDSGRCLEVDQRWMRLESLLARDRQVPGLVRDALTGETGPQVESADDAMRLLRYVLEALQQMEGILRTFQLDRGPSRPQNYGWLNRLGRWSTSKAFRAWWPWLSPSVTRRLRRFLEKKFELPPVHGGIGTVRPVEGSRSGYAYERWLRTQDDVGDEQESETVRFLRYGYFIPFQAAGPGGQLMAAFARVRLTTVDEQTPLICCWTPEHLHLPAGLWGIGVAEAFMKGLADRLERDLKSHPAGLRLEVHFAEPPQNAELTAYTGAGFEIRGLEATKLVPHTDE